MKRPGIDTVKRLLLEDELRNLADVADRLARIEERLAHSEASGARLEGVERRVSTLREEATARLARIESLLRAAQAERDRLGGLHERVEALRDTLHDDARLRAATARILSGALRDAGAEDHDRLANALAPYLIGPVRAEIANSHDAIIEALHPRMGALVRAAVAGAVADLNRKVDEALPIERWIAALKARVTGAPAAGWLLTPDRPFIVREALLIDRTSGALLAREATRIGDGEEPSDPAGLDDDLLAGMISALHAFAQDAFGAQGGELRRMTTTDETVYLRASPTRILALRCSGAATPEVEARIDQLLERAIERERGGEVLALDAAPLMADAKKAAPGGGAASRMLWLGAGAVALALFALWLDARVSAWRLDRWSDDLRAAVFSDPALDGYPLAVELTADGRGARIFGLTPDEAARAALLRRIEEARSPLVVETAITVAGERGAR